MSVVVVAAEVGSLLLPSDDQFLFTFDRYQYSIQHIDYAGKGKSYIEQTETNTDFANEMSTLWQQSGLHGKALSSHDMDILLWQKLAANCVINPLTAILRCPNGQLLMEPSFPEYLVGVTEEVAAVTKACGTIDNRLEETSLLQFVGEVIRDTANNRSSMNQDARNMRETEIDHLNGFIVRKGRQLRIECPVNKELWSRIKDLY